MFYVEQIYPSGLRKLLVWIKNEYNNPPVFVTGSGYSDVGRLHDLNRTRHYVVSKVHVANPSGARSTA
jgi:beta-glucosidase/6-phospho-beta-glucosidase/beta-galactosidase